MKRHARRFRAFLVAIPPVPPQALAAFHASVGVAILGGDEARFSGPSFAGARQLGAVFGIPEHDTWVLWGVLLLVVGTVVLFGWPWLESRHPRVALGCVAFGAAPMIFLVIGFVTSLHLSRVASSSPIGAYGALAVFHVHTAVWMVRHGVWDQRRADGAWERRRPRQFLDDEPGR